MVFAENILRIFRENKLLAKYRLKDVFVFGSSVRTATPNDIDLLVRDFQDYNDLLSLRKELSEKTGKSVDVVIEKFANPIILYRANKESIRVEWPQERPFPLVGNARIPVENSKVYTGYLFHWRTSWERRPDDQFKVYDFMQDMDLP